MKKVFIRNHIKLFFSFVFIWLYIPHFIMMASMGKKKISLIFSDIKVMKPGYKLYWNNWLCLLFFLHTNTFYRTLFYRRIGPERALLISWLRPGNSTLILPFSCIYGKSMLLFHPFSTVLNAEKIGDNLICHQCVTIGKKDDSSLKRPTIGNNVMIGVGSIILGDISIGNNVKIGAGSIITKDIPDNAIVVGNPFKIIGYNL